MQIVSVSATSIRNSTKVTLQRDKDSGLDDITLTCYSVGPQYVDEVNDELPSPKPAYKGFARDKRGKVEADANGRPIKLYEDDDPDFLQQMSRCNQLHMIALIYRSLDPNEVQWSTERAGMTADEFYSAIRKEMSTYGFSIGDIAKLVAAVRRVSDLNEDDLDEVKEDFFTDGE